MVLDAEYIKRLREHIGSGGNISAMSAIHLLDAVEQLQDALGGLVDWVNEGCPDGGRYALVEAKAALQNLTLIENA